MAHKQEEMASAHAVETAELKKQLLAKTKQITELNLDKILREKAKISHAEKCIEFEKHINELYL